MSFTILAFGSVADAVGEGCLKPIEIGAHDVEVFVRHNAGKVLAHAAPHDARFAVVYGEAFFTYDRRDMGCEPLDPPLEHLVAGKCQIVGVASVST